MGGYAGYISLGNSAFIGLGAYTTAILSVHQQLSPFFGCLAGGLVSAIVAATLSLVTRRTRGMYFVIVTFVTLLLLALVTTTWSDLTGGSKGLPLPTWSLSYQNWPFYYPLLALLIVSVAVSALIQRSKFGLGLIAIRDNEDKAAGIGLRTALYKMLAFVLGGTFLGIAGGIYAYDVSFLNAGAVFDIVTSVLIVLAALLGGRGTLWGPVIGAFLLEPLANFTSTSIGGENAGAIRLLIFGGLLGVVVLFLPRGVLPTAQIVLRRSPLEPVGAGSGPAHPPTPGRGAAAASTANPGAGRSNAGEPVLEVRGLVKAFGGVHAVDRVDLTVEEGSITALIGPNGSGKTTLFNLIDGTIKPRSGHIALRGQAIEGRSRPSRAHRGIARTYQLPRLFPGLSVIENVVAPEQGFAFTRLWRRRVTAAERQRAIAVLDRLGLVQFADTSPSELSYGQRKLVELAQALWLDPLLVMLDEPAAGISPALSQTLSEMIMSLHQRGVAVLFVEHDLAFLAALAQRVYVMATGRVIAHGTISEVSADPAVIDAYLGDDPIAHAEVVA